MSAPVRWAHHLLQPAPGAAHALSDAEAQRVQRHHDRLLAALRARDRPALRAAQQEVLQAAFAAPSAQAPCSPALRRALRGLAWRMAGLRLLWGE